jgi:hypothetical protein
MRVAIALDPSGTSLWAKVFDGNVGLNGDGYPGTLQLIDVGMDDAGKIYVATVVDGASSSPNVMRILPSASCHTARGTWHNGCKYV